MYEGSPFFICREVVYFGAESVNTAHSRKLFIEFMRQGKETLKKIYQKGHLEKA